MAALPTAIEGAAPTMRWVIKGQKSFLLALLAAAGCAQSCIEEEQSGSTAAASASPPAIQATLSDGVLIDTKAKTVTVYRNSEVVQMFPHAAFGAGGSRVKQKRGDNITPLGRFTLGAPRPSKRFSIFIPFHYPSLEYAERAHNAGNLNNESYVKITAALAAGKQPPQDTMLGGMLGIHGLGKGDKEIHRLFNWTAGCIALDNDQIRKLASLIRPGMVAEIR